MKNKLLLLLTIVIGTALMVGCNLTSVTDLEFAGDFKQEYKIGDKLEVTLKVTIDGKENEVTLEVDKDGKIVKSGGYDFTVTGFNTTTAGTKTLKIKLNNVTLTSMYVVAGVSVEGTGTINSPYLIDSPNEFLEIADDTKYVKQESGSTYFKITANISFSGYVYVPLNMKCDFVIDGNNKTLSNISRYDSNISSMYTGESNVGLFGLVKDNNVEIKNLNITNVEFSGKDMVAGIIGKVEGSKTNITFENVHVVNATINSTHFSGGFIGHLQSASVIISNSSVKNSLITTYYNATGKDDGDKAGGFVGFSNGKLKFSNVTVGARIAGIRDLGLLVGFGHTKVSAATNDIILDGKVTILPNSSIVATLTTDDPIINGSGAVAQPNVGVLFGCLMTTDSKTKEEYYRTLSFSKLVTPLDTFGVYKEDGTKLYSDAEYGILADAEYVTVASYHDGFAIKVYGTDGTVVVEGARLVGSVRISSSDAEIKSYYYYAYYNSEEIVSAETRIVQPDNSN